MTGEEYLEQAAKAMKQYMDVNNCGFCKRKAEGINRAIVGLREVTGEAQQLAMKIQERKELAGIDKPMGSGGLELPPPRPMASYAPPVPKPLPERVGPIVSDATRRRIADQRMVGKKAQLAPTPLAPPKPKVELEEKTDLRGMLKNRPKLRDILYVGD